MKSAFPSTNAWPTVRTSSRRSTSLRSCAVGETSTPVETIHEPTWSLNDAFQSGLGREVQIKQLRPFAAANPRLRHDFTQEMRTTAQLRHPNLIQIYEAFLQDDQPYVVLERLHGLTLQQQLDQLHRQHRMMGAQEAVEIVAALADLVDYAHRHGARVLNLRPDSIVLTGNGHPVLTALGSHQNLATARTNIDDLAFIAPEYLAGSTADNRSDVYSLGVLLALLLTGNLPFGGSIQSVLASKQWEPNLPHLDQMESDGAIPAPLATVLRHATARDLDQRYDSAADFQQDLLTALEQIDEVPAVRMIPQAPVVRPQPVVSAPVAVPAPTPSKALMVAEGAPEILPMADPMLLPGMERAEFQAALPYVVLVPLPETPAVTEAAPALVVPEPPKSAHMSPQLWLLLIITVVVTIGAAITLG